MKISLARVMMFILAILATLQFVSLAYVSASYITIIAAGFVMTYVWVLFSKICTKD